MTTRRSDIPRPGLLKPDNAFYRVREGDLFGDLSFYGRHGVKSKGRSTKCSESLLDFGKTRLPRLSLGFLFFPLQANTQAENTRITEGRRRAITPTLKPF
jgi:hypothetical protein